MIIGLPYSDEVRLYDLKVNNCIECKIPLYDLVQRVLLCPKNYVCFVGEYLTWVDDICFDYKSKHCFLPYFRYDIKPTSFVADNDAMYYAHVLVDEYDQIQLRYNYELAFYEIKLNDTLLVYSIKDKQFFKVHIDKYIQDDINFCINTLYDLYRNACFLDYNSDFGKHEDGYTLINRQFVGFSNKERTCRKELGLSAFKDDIQPKFPQYRDVRYYQYFDVIARYPKLVPSTELFKYRNLRFESYLYCNLMNKNVPIDCNSWKKLGKQLRYIKIKQDIPFFIKYYWLQEYDMSVNESWLRL